MTNEERSAPEGNFPRVAELRQAPVAESGIARLASAQDARWGSERDISGRPLPGTTREAAGVEAAVLGTMLFDRSVIEHVYPVVDASDFFGGLNRHVFSALGRIRHRRARVDVNRLAAELSREIGTSDLEGSAYLEDLRARVCVPGIDAERHARRVREAAGWRRMIDLGERTIRAAHQGAQERSPCDHVAVRLVGNALVFQQNNAGAPRRGAPFPSPVDEMFRDLVFEGRGDPPPPYIRKLVMKSGCVDLYGERPLVDAAGEQRWEWFDDLARQIRRSSPSPQPSLTHAVVTIDGTLTIERATSYEMYDRILAGADAVGDSDTEYLPGDHDLHAYWYVPHTNDAGPGGRRMNKVANGMIWRITGPLRPDPVIDEDADTTPGDYIDGIDPPPETGPVVVKMRGTVVFRNRFADLTPEQVDLLGRAHTAAVRNLRDRGWL